MMCKTVQATPEAGHSTVLESSTSSQGAAGLNGAARREMEVNGSTAGKKVVDSNELERLFTQTNTQDSCMVSRIVQTMKRDMIEQKEISAYNFKFILITLAFSSFNTVITKQLNGITEHNKHE